MDPVSALVWLLVVLVIVGLVWWISQRIIAAFGIPQPVAVVVEVLIVLIVIVILLRFLNVAPHGVRIF